MIMYSVPEKGNVSQQTGGILNERKYRKHGYDDFMDGCNLWIPVPSHLAATHYQNSMHNRR